MKINWNRWFIRDRGQLLFGRFKAEEQLNLDGSLIYRKLQKMVENKLKCRDLSLLNVN